MEYARLIQIGGERHRRNQAGMVANYLFLAEPSGGDVQPCGEAPHAAVGSTIFPGFGLETSLAWSVWVKKKSRLCTSLKIYTDTSIVSIGNVVSSCVELINMLSPRAAARYDFSLSQ
eukprot:TRINITY_DN922_c0_g1_i1.p2 TRINITY_DN922_c0_g1~~TRINITY_DN922_c0_g1_i1.p2  ORF type:complete len:117 (+),score=4.22 TRINITY_DN922_c0_g1_i1:450-800(+)